jgi:hypothetical protein
MKNNGSDLDQDNLYDSVYLPRMFVGANISHYYGDSVRRFFLVLAVVLLVIAPIFGDASVLLFLLAIMGAFILITLSALTSPRNKLVMVANSAASFTGAVVFELLALAAYRAEAILPMLGLQAVVLAFIFTLYLSLKTVRAMEMGLIGKRDLPGEFMEEKYSDAKEQR